MTNEQTTTVANNDAPRRSPVRTGLRAHANRFSIILAWVVLIVIFGVKEPSTFLTAPDFESIFNSNATLALLAVSLIPTLMVGEFDLSVAAVAGMAGTLTGTLSSLHGVPILPSIICGVLVGAIIGAFNALLVVKFEINTIVVTLGMATLIDGIAVAISDSMTIGNINPSFVHAMTTTAGGLQTVFYISAGVILVAGFVMSQMPIGRRMLFIGQGKDVAVLAGVNVKRIRMAAFIAGGAIAGTSGVLALGVQGGIQPSSAEALLLPAFAAAFLGTVIFETGRFNAWGAAVAVFFLATGITGLEIMGLSGWISNVFYGGALIAAVWLSTVVRRRTA